MEPLPIAAIVLPMYKLKTVIDGLPSDPRRHDGDGPVAQSRIMPIPIDSIIPIDEDPKSYLEGRVAFYIALLEELIRRGADRGDIYFMKECVDALLKMTTIGRAKLDMEVTGGVSKLRDEHDFTRYSKEDLEAFISKAKGEADGRAGSSGGVYNLGRSDGGGNHNRSSAKGTSRKRQSSRHNDGPGGEKGVDSSGNEAPDLSGGPGSVVSDLP